MGSISSAILLCRLKNLPDPRSCGSKNPGATNVLRMGGKSLAIGVIFADALKGWLPVMLANLSGMHSTALAVVGMCAVLGHIFPIFFDFKGGKGIATLLGVLLALSGSLALLAVLTWVMVAALFRYSSLAGIVTAITMPLDAYLLGEFGYILPLTLLACLIVGLHRENIKRLWNKTEPRLKKLSSHA